MVCAPSLCSKFSQDFSGRTQKTLRRHSTKQSFNFPSLNHHALVKAGVQHVTFLRCKEKEKSPYITDK